MIANRANSEDLAKKLRLHALRMTSRARSSHIGSCLSMTDLLAVLYAEFLDVRPEEPDWPERDRLLVSKGHAAAVLYAVLAEVGFFPLDRLDRYGEDGQPLSGHVTHSNNPGVEASSGSLGHGLSLGAGIAVGLRKRGSDARVVVLLSDGECDEGSIWEAALFAPHHKLSNLVAIVDYNKIQSFGSVKDVLDLEPFADKWRAFGWNVIEIDGHDHADIRTALEQAKAGDAPTVVIAHTIKGKGVSFMEGRLEWHYKSASPEQLQQAIEEVAGA